MVDPLPVRPPMPPVRINAERDIDREVAISSPVVTEKVTKTTIVDPPFWQGVLDDLHVNLSGLVMFSCMAVGVIRPQYTDQCTKLAALAATYLFSSAKAK